MESIVEPKRSLNIACSKYVRVTMYASCGVCIKYTSGGVNFKFPTVLCVYEHYRKDEGRGSTKYESIEESYR